METITITKTITQPTAIINQFANDLGYQEVVSNPDHIPAVVDITTMEETSPAVGEPTIPNPQTRLEFVSERFDEFVSENFFGQFAKRNAERQKAEEAKQLARQTIDAIKATIVTT